MKTKQVQKIQNNILRQEISSRGGGIEISLDKYGFNGEKMTAYQNYLGGGILGRVNVDCSIKEWQKEQKLCKISEILKRYLHNLTNPSEEYWESIPYELNEQLPTSAY